MDNEEIQGVKFSEFPSQTPSNSDEVVGLHSGDNARFTIANIIAAVRQGLANIFVPKSDVGAVNGVASLDNTGKVPTSQLPSSTGPEPATATPLMDGTGAVGVSTKYAREDHEHPADTNKQNKITANGILKGDGAGGVSAAVAGTDYQAPLTIDSTPTANSTNPVQSGGVYTDVRTRVPNYGKGVNLLRNWYFVGGGTGRGVFPVNSRGQNLYSASGYTIDGWAFSANGYTQTLTSAGLQITGSRNQYYLLNQKISDASAGKTVTFAIWSNYGMTTRTLTMSDGYGYAIGDHFSIDISINSGSHYIYIGFKSTEATGTSLNITFYAVGAFLGTEQTLCHNEGTAEASVWVLNDVPDYEYELYRCMTSTADSTDTYANKSLATEQQLAYVESGTTASRNYTAGQYISLNGLLYTADTAIAIGATFYTSGGNKNLTECVGGGLNEALFVDIPYNSFEWYTGLPAFRALYTVPTGYYIAAINVFFTNGSAIAGPRYSSGYIYIVGLNGRGQAIDSTYEFVCTVMLRKT